MSNTCCAAVDSSVIRVTPVALALAAMLAVSPLADAASIGHSRLVSEPGQPLSITIPIRELSAAELQSLRVGAAPASAWQQAGLVPPVQLSSLQFTIHEGFTPDSRVVQVYSSQPFGGPVADLLLQVDTAAGSRQYQVSLLAQGSRPGALAGAGNNGAGSTLGVAAGAPSASRSIAVRRGDTLFALARANAVEEVSVYQMMVALHKANPQAFIDSNMNLVKAGANLAIPDAAALRAVSDREARRIFQQHAQAFAAYRDRVAAQRSPAMQRGSTQQGAVSSGAAPVLAAPASAAQDQVVLSSGQASDAARDEQEAARQNIDESQARVSQLERNVHDLNQALQMQGEAAIDAVVEGAAVVSQTLSEAATNIGLSDQSATRSGGAASGGASASSATSPGTGTTSGQGATSLGTSASASAQLASEQGRPAQDVSGQGASVQGSSVQGGSAQDSSVQGSSVQGSSVQGSSVQGQSGQGQSGQTGQVQGDSVAPSSAPLAGAGASSAAGVSTSGAGGAATQAGTAASSSSAGSQTTGQARSQAEDGSEHSPKDSISSSKAEQSVSWFQENMLGVITGVLALLVLIIAWFLRRASASRNDESHGGITEAMVQERLETIDFDLNSPPADQRPPHST